jgi:hypothetical protein
MKILIADVFLRGKPNEGWKEGYVLKYAFENLGHECDVFGPDGDRSELEIPMVANQYDLIVITENYWWCSDWKWWNWEEIKKPKIFWAIDTHMVDYRPWIEAAGIDYVAINNKEDYIRYGLKNSFWLPVFVSKFHYDRDYGLTKTRDVAFIGSISPERKEYCDRLGIEYLSAFGDEYVREMQRSKICFNKSMSSHIHDGNVQNLNAKTFEIIGSGTFMLTNYNSNLEEFTDNNEYIRKMFYYSDDDLKEKIEYYLKNEEEREFIAKKAREYVLENHSGESRCKMILENINI